MKPLKSTSFFRDRVLPFLMVLIVLPLFWVMTCEGEERQRPSMEYDRSNPTANGSRYPTLHSPDGESVWMSWVTRIEEGVSAIEFSRYRDGRWQPPRSVRVGNDVRVHWSESPSVTAPSMDEPVIHWMHQRDDVSRTRELRFSWFDPDVRDWRHLTAADGSPIADRGSASVISDGNRTVRAAWAEEISAEGSADEGVSAAESPAEEAESSLQSVLRTALLNMDGDISASRELTTDVSSCTAPRMISTPEGPLVIYRQSESEAAEVARIRLDSDGTPRGDPETVSSDGWRMETCRPALPAAASRQQQVMIAWDDHSGESPAVRLAWSEDSGDRFSEPVSLDRPAVLGRVAVAAGDDAFHLVWKEPHGSLAAVMIQRVEHGEPVGEPIRLATTGPEEQSGLPSVVSLEEGLLIAWTQTSPFYRVRTAFVPYSDFLHNETD